LNTLAILVAGLGAAGSLLMGYIVALIARSGWDAIAVIGFLGCGATASWAAYLMYDARPQTARRLLLIALGLGGAAILVAFAIPRTGEGALQQATRNSAVPIFLAGAPLLCLGLAGLLARIATWPPTQSGE
jgi:hypothetical protein